MAQATGTPAAGGSRGWDRALGALQSVGRSLMLPIAVLPAAALLLRLGQDDLLGLPWMAAAGAAIFDNLPVLFAIGIAVGLTGGAGAAGLAGLVSTGYLGYIRLTTTQGIGDRPLLLLGMLLLVVGVQLVTFGLLAELLARTYYESQNKPVYVIREIRQTPDLAHAEP